MPFTRRMMAAGAIVGLLIPMLWFATYVSGSQVFVPQIFNLQWTDYVSTWSGPHYYCSC
ncbi:MAG TPA: hypothetical protein VK884_09060 [Verrucomicrobiae bacterium]|nr:hypothetical protein [Verrucomicrobiae bacterium]